jgi:hypothetical protein
MNGFTSKNNALFRGFIGVLIYLTNVEFLVASCLIAFEPALRGAPFNFLAS